MRVKMPVAGTREEVIVRLDVSLRVHMLLFVLRAVGADGYV